MCLPQGLLSFVAKICTIYILGFSLYCFYYYAANGFLSIIGQSLPLFTIIMLFLLTGFCSCLGLNKKVLLAGVCTFFLGILTLAAVLFINNVAGEYFDLSKDCTKLKKSNPMLEVFIDPNMDNYFNNASSILCSQSCPCKWTQKTEVLKKNPSKFVVDTKNGAKNVLECPDYLQDIEFQMDKKHYIQMMMQLEVYGCSGYCKKNEFFVMSDINQGVPKHTCFDVNRHIQRLSLNTILMGLHLLSWSLVLLLPVSCCLYYQFSQDSTEREEMIEKVQKLKSELGPELSKKLKKKVDASKSNKGKNEEESEEEAEEEGEGEDEGEEKAKAEEPKKRQDEKEDNTQKAKTAAQKKDD